MIVGARFACGRRLRGYSLICPRCERERIDLATPEAGERLSATWSMAALHRDGVDVTAPRSLLHPRMTGLVVVFLVLLAGSLVGLISIAPRTEPHELMLFFLVVAGVSAPLAVIVFGRFVRMHQRAQSIAATPPPGSWLVPTIEIDALPPQPTLGTARVTHEIVIGSTRDLASWMPRDDAWIETGSIELEGETLRIEHAAGSILWNADELPPSRNADPESYRERAAHVVPRWTHDANRTVTPRRRVLSIGTELIVRGGRVTDGALWGTREHPLHLEVRVPRETKTR